MNDQWIDDLRNRMEQHSEPVPEELWDNIEQILRSENNAKAMLEGKTTRMWYMRAGAAAAAAIILILICLHTWKENQKNTQFAGQPKYEQTVPPTLHPIKKETIVNKEEQHLVLNTRAERTASKKQERIAETHVPNVITDEHEKIGDENKQQQPGKETSASGETENRQPAGNNEQLPGFGENNTPGFQLYPHRHKHKPAKWQTGLYAANIPSGTAKTYNGYGSLSPYKSSEVEEENILAAIPSDFPSDVPELNEYQHIYTDIEHYQTITLGVSIKYNLDERWSLASGLTYNILSSQLRSGNNNNYYNSQQTLHYLGIPLNINYTVWGHDKTIAYVSGGGLVEKNVAGTLTTDFIVGNNLQMQNRQEISVKPLQWSVNSAVGIQYQLYKNIGIYAEPGVAYYFKNKSDVMTIYKEKPLNFNLKLGLRFSLNK